MSELPFAEATRTFGDTLTPCNTTLDCSVSSDGSPISQAKVACLRLLSNDVQKYCSCRSVILGWYSGEWCEKTSPLMYFNFFVEVLSGIIALYQTFGFITVANHARFKKNGVFVQFCILESISSSINIFWQSSRLVEHLIPSGEVANHYSYIMLYIMGTIGFISLHTGASILIWSWYNTVLSKMKFSCKMRRIRLLTYLSIAVCIVAFFIALSTSRVGEQAPNQTYLLLLLLAIGLNFYIISSIGSMVSSAVSQGDGAIYSSLYEPLKLFHKSLRSLLRYLYCGFLLYVIGLGLTVYTSSMFGDALKLFVPVSQSNFMCIRIAGFMMRQGLLRNGRGIVTNFAAERTKTLVPTKSHLKSSKGKSVKSIRNEYVDESARPETLILESVESGPSHPSTVLNKGGANLEK